MNSISFPYFTIKVPDIGFGLMVQFEDGFFLFYKDSEGGILIDEAAFNEGTNKLDVLLVGEIPTKQDWHFLVKGAERGR